MSFVINESLAKAFVAHPQIELYLLVNAYDDGLSTGRLRRFIPGLLGPSDFRKNIAHLIPDSDEGGNAVKRLLEYSLPEKMDSVIRNLKKVVFVKRIFFSSCAYLKNAERFFFQKQLMSIH